MYVVGAGCGAACCCLLLAAAVVAVVDAATEGNTTRADYFCLSAEERVREKGRGARDEVVEQGVLGCGACCLCQEGSAALGLCGCGLRMGVLNVGCFCFFGFMRPSTGVREDRRKKKGTGPSSFQNADEEFDDG